jgi:hypothetical protein
MIEAGYPVSGSAGSNMSSVNTLPAKKNACAFMTPTDGTLNADTP